MPVTQIGLERLRDAKVRWRSAGKPRRAAVLVGLVGVSAAAAVLTAASALAVNGTEPGNLRFDPPSGPKAVTPIWSTAPRCPSGYQGSAVLYELNTDGSPSTGTNVTDGGTSEWVVGCYSGPGSSGGVQYVASSAAPTLSASYRQQGLTPNDNCSVDTCTPIAATEPISVTVPQPGSFTVTVTANAMALTPSVHPLVFGGKMPDITVTDTRSSVPGWSASGQVSDFTGAGTAAGSVISGNQLGWTPLGTVVGGATLGSPVDPANPGLGSIPAVLASAAAGSGFGKHKLSAKVLLDIPVSARAGPYRAILTITCVSSQVSP